MGHYKKRSLFLTVGAILIVLIVLAWFVFRVFEGEKPKISLQPFPEFLSEDQQFTLDVSDMKRGLKRLEVTLTQGGRKVDVLKKSFLFSGFFNREGTRSYHTESSIDPSELNLAQGRVDLNVKVWDHSRRSGGDGNLSIVQHKMVIDTIPPAIRAMSRNHYINTGGTGLVVYQTSSDSVESGVFVNDRFFKGYPAHESSQDGYHVCYFAVPPDTRSNPQIYLWTEDRAGNNSKTSFYFHVRRKNFRTEKLTISDRFLNRVLPYFSFYSFASTDSDVDKFLEINQKLRKENAQTYYNMRTETAPTKLWEGKWMRLKNAANMAGYGDRRKYYYNRKKIDNQVHMGVDLASLANSEVPAANSGRVIFADRLGIYGNTVVVDHGQGLASTYSHLNKIDVQVGQELKKGETLGLTGQTGLAGGDHLHFGVLVNGTFVNPIEWWDPHWIQDNITRKLALLK
jgi:murein DD-endopeptidase MepM/ murein hydrolase activator NlpD